MTTAHLPSPQKEEIKLRARKLQIYLIALLLCLFFTVFALNILDLRRTSNKHAYYDEENGLKSQKHSSPSPSPSYLLKYPKDAYLELTDEENWCLKRGIVLTREYQMKLNLAKFYNRSEGINEHLAHFYQFFKFPEFQSPHHEGETVRFQLNYDTSLCGRSLSLRQRNYYTGFMANTTTLDIKSSTLSDHPEIGQEKVYDKDFFPGPKYQEGALLKFEADVHPCHIKWSRETRLYTVPFELNITECNQLHELFPFTEKELPHSLQNNKISLSEERYLGWWWELEHKGMTVNGTKWKTAFTLRYPSHDSAVSGEEKPSDRYSEWSIRIWSSNEGHGPWLKSELELIDRAYMQSVFFFQTPDIPCSSPSPMIPPKWPLPQL